MNTKNKIRTVQIAEYSGYCFGVSRAMQMAEETLNDVTIRHTYAIGPLIHNEQAMEVLKNRGLIINEKIDEFEKNSSAIIRSHGLPKSFYDRMEKASINIIDATCPFVKKIQNLVFKASNSGYRIIVIGDFSHPEVQGIVGWAAGEVNTFNTIEELESWIPAQDEPYLAVVQTTFNLERYERMAQILTQKISNLELHNTICYATKQRQESAAALSEHVDAMIVIGGKESSNTKKLAEICRKNCMTFLIESVDTLCFDDIKELEHIGIVAGASTPDFVVQEVYDYIVNKIHI